MTAVSESRPRRGHGTVDMTTRYRDSPAIGIPCSKPRPSTTTPMYMLWGVLAFLINILLTGTIDDIRGYLAFGYFSQTVVFAALNMSRHNYALIRLLQPSMITIIYLGLSCAVGAWAFHSGNVPNILGKEQYDFWPNLKEVYVLISTSLLFLYFLSLRTLRMPMSDSPPARLIPQKVSGALIVAIALSLLLFLSTFLKIGIVSQLKTVVSAALFYVLFRHDVKYKWILAALAIGILAATSPQSKREAIFAIPAMILITLGYFPTTKVTINKLIMAVISLLLIVVLILAMSILRGYGSMNASGITDAITFIPQYMGMTNSLGFIFNNFEVTYLFLHVHQSVSASLDAYADLAHGETYVRMLLIWPIGDILGYKPPSIIDQYTGAFFPSFRDEGGSFVVTSIGEAAWNFGWLAPMALLLVYYGLDSLFVWSVRLIRNHGAWGTIFALNAFQYSLYYSRGSGLDIMAIYLLFSTACGLLIALVLKMLHLDRARPRRRGASGIPREARGSA